VGDFLADAHFGAGRCWDLGVGRFELHPSLKFVLESPKKPIFASIVMASGLLGSPSWWFWWQIQVIFQQGML
jgi:hypothetical protein